MARAQSARSPVHGLGSVSPPFGIPDCVSASAQSCGGFRVAAAVNSLSLPTGRRARFGDGSDAQDRAEAPEPWFSFSTSNSASTQVCRSSSPLPWHKRLSSGSCSSAMNAPHSMELAMYSTTLGGSQVFMQRPVDVCSGSHWCSSPGLGPRISLHLPPCVHAAIMHTINHLYATSTLRATRCEKGACLQPVSLRSFVVGPLYSLSFRGLAT